MAESYAARSRREPEWRLAQIAGAVERERRRREADPELHRARRREATARCRARQAAENLTLHELARRIGADPADLRRTPVRFRQAPLGSPGLVPHRHRP